MSFLQFEIVFSDKKVNRRIRISKICSDWSLYYLGLIFLLWWRCLKSQCFDIKMFHLTRKIVVLWNFFQCPFCRFLPCSEVRSESMQLDHVAGKIHWTSAHWFPTFDDHPAAHRMTMKGLRWLPVKTKKDSISW